MNVRAGLRFSFSAVRDDWRANSMTDDWSSRIANGIKQKRAAIDNENAALAEQQKLRQEQGPNLWNLLREDIKQLSLEINKKTGSETLQVRDLKEGEISVWFRESGDPKVLKATFKVSSADDALSWDVPSRPNQGKSGKCSLSIERGGNVVLKDSVHGILPTRDIAQFMLEALVGE